MLLAAAVSNLAKAMPNMTAKGKAAASSVETYYLPLLLCSVVGIGEPRACV